MLDGLMGTGNGTTSTSINVGIVGLTKVSSYTAIYTNNSLLVFCVC